ncbi:MAG: hypothetical protein KC505_08675 [Myxococcales bacterium]|nr:hypothetical protein [Myxococcales bacterium]USN51625.1 MAG: hypothetical protein H6731_04235 [Myxococcales bacterium]
MAESNQDYSSPDMNQFATFPFFSYVEILENLSLLKDEFFKQNYHAPVCHLLNERLKGAPIAVELKIDSKFNPKGNRTRTVVDAKQELKQRFMCP